MNMDITEFGALCDICYSLYKTIGATNESSVEYKGILLIVNYGRIFLLLFIQ